jgi:lysophospholipase L1-like esterase
MKRVILTVLAVLAVLIGIAAYFTGPMFYEFWKLSSNDPAVYAGDIAEFTDEDALHPPPKNAVLFVGHSNIRYWEDLQEHMQPLTVIRRGFGGAKVNDLLFYADEIISPYAPRAIVINIGGNDIFNGLGNKALPVPDVFATYKKLIAHIRSRLPDPPIYFLAITAFDDGSGKPDPAIQLNKLIREFSAQGERLLYMDASDSILNAEGNVDAELLRSDGAHLNADGYTLLAVPVRERLLNDEPGWDRQL